MADIATPRQPRDAGFGDLTNPTQWMALVGDKTKLTAWYKSLSPNAPDDHIAYYVEKTMGQPGANPTEQAGSAAYWAGKFTSDPKSLATGSNTVLGAGGGADGLGRTIPPGTPVDGTAVPRGTALGGNPGDTYGAAYLAAQLQRKRAQAGGRQTTILGGFSGGTPTTRPATALGGY